MFHILCAFTKSAYRRTCPIDKCIFDFNKLKIRVTRDEIIYVFLVFFERIGAGGIEKISTAFYKSLGIFENLTLSFSGCCDVLFTPVGERILTFTEHSLTGAGSIYNYQIKHPVIHFGKFCRVK